MDLKSFKWTKTQITSEENKLYINAWFAANNQVEANGMQLTAQGESGIVIKSVDNDMSAFGTTASAGMDTATPLKPVSTIDLAAWYHATSEIQDDAQASQVKDNYSDVTESASEYMVKKDFIIRSASAGVPITNSQLAVADVSVTKQTSNSVNLDKAVRVGVKIGNTFYIYAPMAEGNFALTATYVEDAAELVEKKTAVSTTDTFALPENTIPANDTGLTASIYMWFEGEDTNCKSTNVTLSLDDLNVSVKFITASI